jgi:integrase
LTTREIAESVLESIRAAIADGATTEAAVAPFLPRSQASVEQKLEVWLEHLEGAVKRGDLSPTYLREIRRYAQPEGHFSYLHGRSVCEIRYAHIQDWISWLADRGLSAKSRSLIVGAFHALLGWLHERGDLDKLPRFPPMHVPTHRPKTISPVAQDAILDEVPEDRRGAFISMVELLIRPGEARALNVSDYSWRERTITVSSAMKGLNSSAPRRGTKEDDIRGFEVSGRLADWLERHVSQRDRLQGDRPLFVNPGGKSNDKRWNYWSLIDEWRKAARTAGIPGVSLYEGTKHSTATALRRAGVPLDVIQRAAGHKDPRSTERYAQLANQAVVEALRRRNEG